MRWLAVVLLVVGLSRMAADGLGALFPDAQVLAAIEGVAAATTCAPAPKVFSAVQGLETYSTRFFIEGTKQDGSFFSVELTPEVYGRLRGPYNRRNVYGAALAYGPVLSGDPLWGPLWESVMRWALCGDAPVLTELGIDPAELSGPVHLRYEARPGTDLGALATVLGAPCP